MEGTFMNRRLLISFRFISLTAALTVLMPIFGCATPVPQASDDRSAPVSIKLVTCINDSGLLDNILPVFTSETGIEVDVISAGTGRALELAKAGDVDVVLVHDPDSEIQFINDGYGLARFYVAQNEWAIVGPKTDPAHVISSSTVADAYRAIMDSGSIFISRADKSAVHLLELNIWADLVVTPSGEWYIQAPTATLGDLVIMADEMQAYTMIDTSTFHSMEDQLNLSILYPQTSPSDDPALLNIYSIISLNPSINPDLKLAEANKLIDWLTGPEGRELITGFQVNGRNLYYVNPDGYTSVTNPLWGN